MDNCSGGLVKSVTMARFSQAGKFSALLVDSCHQNVCGHKHIYYNDNSQFPRCTTSVTQPRLSLRGSVSVMLRGRDLGLGGEPKVLVFRREGRREAPKVADETLPKGPWWLAWTAAILHAEGRSYFMAVASKHTVVNA
jgi:hypothetical protein